MKSLDYLLMSYNKEMSLMGDWEILYNIVCNTKIKIKVEIGTALGMTAMLLSSGDGKVFTIDNFGGDQARHNIISAFLRMYSNGKIESIFSDSVEASKRFSDNSVDFLFIDGGHSYEQIDADFKAWFPKVKNQGLIAFHDTDIGHPWVFQFMSEEVPLLIKNGRLIEQVIPHENDTIIRVFMKENPL